MSHSIILADQTVVELSFGDACSGPNDCFGKLHVNTTVLFYRVNGKTWKRCGGRSMQKANQLLKSCESIDDLKVLE